MKQKKKPFAGMIRTQFSFTRDSLSQRPANSKAIIADVAPKIDCTSCGGVCCKNTPSLDVDNKDPNLHFILARAREIGLSVEDLEFAFVLDMPGNECSFLEDGLCGIYENRPTTCRLFPLITHGLDSELHERPFIMAFSQDCPPIRFLTIWGIPAILSSDIVVDIRAALDDPKNWIPEPRDELVGILEDILAAGQETIPLAFFAPTGRAMEEAVGRQEILVFDGDHFDGIALDDSDIAFPII